jgi:putative DNA primase/helicase
VKAHGIRQADGVLVVPMRSGEQIYSAQFINADGEKRFLPGGRIKGCWHLIEGHGTRW